MICTDRIIVLQHTRFSDTSIIVQALSKLHGRISLMVYGVGGKNKNKIGFFHPLAILDVVYSYKADRGVQKLTEHKLSPPLLNCITDMRKSTMLTFLAEIINKCIREEIGDAEQFKFIETSIQILEQIDNGTNLFHIAFLTRLSRYLGFAPNNIDPLCLYFDIEQSEATITRPHHKHYVSTEFFLRIMEISALPYDQLGEVRISKSERDTMLDTIIKWYSFRISTMNSINSLEVLQDVFSVA